VVMPAGRRSPAGGSESTSCKLPPVVSQPDAQLRAIGIAMAMACRTPTGPTLTPSQDRYNHANHKVIPTT
jgi:hypothetical protein